MEENKEEVVGDGRKVIKLSRKKFKRIVISLVVIIVILILGSVIFGNFSRVRYMGSTTMNRSAIPTMDLGRSKSSENMLPPGYYNDNYYNNNQPSISDTREFLKTDYRASINTRDVSKVVKFIENAIKGADGRVDSISSSEKNGYIKFVVAKSEFEDFRKEIEELIHEKLYTENISSVNLLTEKQGIEEQQGNIVNSLENWTAQRDALVTKHNQTVASINKEIARIGKDLVSVRISIKAETDNLLLASLVNQEYYLIEQEKVQKKNLATENSNYAVQKQNLDNLINNENSNLTNINKVDSQFMDNVETVNGYINVSWVSLWDMSRIFSPIHPIFIIIIIIILAFAFLRKSRFVPKVVLE